jgi:predicted site-specific integrase-resolvase
VKKFLRKAAVAERYGVNVRTIDRMTRDGRIPQPHYRGKFPLFDETELDAADRAAVLASRKDSKAA